MIVKRIAEVVKLGLKRKKKRKKNLESEKMENSLQQKHVREV